MGGNQDHEEVKEPVEDLAKEITRKYVRELNSEAIKKALKNKTRNLSEKESKKLENQLKNLNDEEKLSRFKEASEEISKGILEGSIRGDNAIEEMGAVFENSLKIKASSLAGAALSFKSMPLPVKIAMFILVPFLAATALLIMPSLSMSPGDLNFDLDEGESGSDQFQVSNTGGGVLLWTASSDQPWITLSPKRGANEGTVIVLVDAEDMEEGTYEGSITIESPAGKEQCPVYLSVEPSYKSPNPVLAVSPDPLSFYFDLVEGESDDGELEISNDGGGILEWEVRIDEPWITPSLRDGTNSETVTFIVDTEDLSPGEEYEGTISIESNGGDEEGRIYLNVLPEEEEQPQEEQPQEEQPEEEQPQEEPTLAVDPDPLSFYFDLSEGESDYEEFYISNDGEGTLEWEVKADKLWISLSPESGTNSETVTVTVDTNGLSPGEEYEGNITIESNGGDEEGTIYLNVLPGEEPILSVDPEPLYFSFNLTTEEEDSEEFYISNDGEGTLEWEVRADEPWINLDPEGGTDSGTVTVTVDTDGLSPGEEYEGNITIESNGGDEEGTIYLALPGEEPILVVDPDPIDFNFYLTTGESDSEEFYISNEGEGILEWEVYADEPWITLDPESGTNSETVTATVDTEELSPEEEYEGNITIESNGGDEEGTIHLVMQGEEPILVVDPDPLYFNFELIEGDSDYKEFNISNGGGGDLEWEVHGDPDSPSWISIDPVSGTNSETVTVTVEAADLIPERYSATFKIVSNGGDEKGTVNLSVLPAYEEPMLATRPETLNFFFKLINGQPEPEQFQILNEGGGKLEWQVSSDQWWITLNPEGGTNSGNVTCTVDTSEMYPGEYRGNITINSNGGIKTGKVTVVIEEGFY